VRLLVLLHVQWNTFSINDCRVHWISCRSYHQTYILSNQKIEDDKNVWNRDTMCPGLGPAVYDVRLILQHLCRLNKTLSIPEFTTITLVGSSHRSRSL
jgi:hypothetical protein